jgi:very-short-patch-repair endonuclease
MEGLRFRRQVPIDHYIVDFVCFEKRLIVEADGGQHSGSDTDRIRDEYLKKQGFMILRFWNNEILMNIGGVLEKIRETSNDLPPTSVLPREEGG